MKLANGSDWLFLLKDFFSHERNNLFRGDIYFASDIILLENIAEIKIVKIMMNNVDFLVL